MQTGKACFSASVIGILLVTTGVLADTDADMEGSANVSERVVRQSQSLCAGEQDYIIKRKQIILESLSSLGINCTADNVPHIALLGSGGGQRAAVGLMGSLYQMEKDGLLDTLLYLGGVSGSTWSMSSLYSDPGWSTNMDGAVSRLSGPGVELQDALDWLDERSKEEDFSLTDVWGLLTSAGVMKEMDLRNFSSEASRNASDPYPIYNAIEKDSCSDEVIEGKWFEVSPHEAGFTDLDLFVETSLLGSKFDNGVLQERMPEMDMVQLQGVFGSALADEEAVDEYLPPWLIKLKEGGAGAYLRIYIFMNYLRGLKRNTNKQPSASADLDRLDKIIEDKISLNESASWESKSEEEKRNSSQLWGQELLEEVTTWIQSLEEGEYRTAVSLLFWYILPQIVKWEWGTTKNFLYQFQDAGVPPCLHSKDRIHLVDAGLLINVAFPSFLGDKRDIDLLIVPEFSAGLLFETLTLARDYADKVNKSFPELDEKNLDRDWPNGCYVFEGKGKEPTIVYMPLFNRDNCKDAEEVKAMMEEYSTFQRPFTQEKIDFLLERVKANMRTNKETLVREISKAAVRRQEKLSAGGGEEQREA